MKKSIYNKKKNCCGCEACRQICAQGAIDMVEDKEGFEYPQIDKAKCVNCGMCQKVCPIIQRNNINGELKECFVAYTDNSSIRNDSSSGGIFSLLADQVITENGFIIGAAFDKEYNVHHKCFQHRIDDLRGSKYVQSKIGTIFKKVKSHLDSGDYVLFSGTECQIAGLKTFLGKDYNNLLLVGILCHGVPSPMVWRKYKEYLQQGKKIKYVSFRNKDCGWKDFSLKVEFTDGSFLREKFSENLYMQSFLQEICMRPSCYDCKFKNLNRQADITLGDFWEINKYMQELDDDKGISVVLIHSDKGRRIWEKIKEKAIYKSAIVDKAISPYADSRKSVIPHINRSKYLKAIRKNGFSDAVKYLDVSIIDRIRRKITNIIKKYQ